MANVPWSVARRSMKCRVMFHEVSREYKYSDKTGNWILKLPFEISVARRSSSVAWRYVRAERFVCGRKTLDFGGTVADLSRLLPTPLRCVAYIRHREGKKKRSMDTHIVTHITLYQTPHSTLFLKISTFKNKVYPLYFLNKNPLRWSSSREGTW